MRKVYLIPGSLFATGTAVAGAEATGMLADKSAVAWIVSFAMFAGGLVLSLLIWFLKKEYGGIQAMGVKLHALANAVAELKLTLEHELGETRTELARRVEHDAHAREVDQLRTKLADIAETVAYLKAKLHDQEIAT